MKLVFTGAFLIIGLLLSPLNVFSQTYNFTNKEEAIPYKSAEGTTKYHPSGKTSGTYKIVFGTLVDEKRSSYFTLYNNGVEDQWFGIAEKLMNVELSGKIFSHSIYAATSTNEMVKVYVALDGSEFSIIFPGRIVRYSN